VTVPGYLAIARAAQDASMTATCTITRAVAGRTFNKATGTYTDPEPVTVYAGRCKVKSTARAVAEVEAGEQHVAVLDLALHLPIEGTGDVRRDDVARIDTNPDDPALVGRDFVVQAGDQGTTKTARRLPVEDVA